MSEPLRICRDCRWCRYPGDHASPCFHDLASAPAIDLVSGVELLSSIYCKTMREPVGPCGLEARLFEVREATQVGLRESRFWRETPQKGEALGQRAP
jgi:hypothetical protein